MPPTPIAPPASLLALLNEDVARLPRPVRAAGEPFADVLGRTLDAYVGAVEVLRADDWATRAAQDAHARMRVLAARLKDAFAAAQAGQPGAADAEFNAGISAISTELKALVSVPVTRDVFKTRYRVRWGPPHPPYDRGALFHVPFDRAARVGRGRYNPAGIPVLYLGGSLLACWHEARRPTSDVWAAAVRLRPSVEIRVLNLAYRTRRIADLLRGGQTANPRVERPSTRLATSLAVVWPLLAACSFEARGDDSARPEYLIPQQLMRWVHGRDDVAGIRYFSTRIADGDAAIDESANFVFPTRDVATNGFDATLADRFEMADPIFWATLPAGLAALAGEKAAVPASVTTFGHLEEELRGRRFATVHGT
jgi:hypothetical protein